MKKLIIIVIIALASINTYSQKVKINTKAGIMSVDNVEVAQYKADKDAVGQDVFTISDLKSNESITVTIVQADVQRENFLSVSSTLSDKTSDMDFEMIGFTFNLNSVIPNLIVKKHNFFTNEGINKEAVINFLSKENKKHTQALTIRREEQKVRQEKLDRLSPIIQNKKTAINSNTNELIAQFEKPSKTSEDILIKDSRGNHIATIKTKVLDGDYVYTLDTFDENTFIVKKEDKKDIRQSAIESLIVNNYLGDNENCYEKRKLEFDKMKAFNEIEDAKRSKVQGILTLKNQEVIEGFFDIKFRQTPEGILSSTRKGSCNNTESQSIGHYADESATEVIKTYQEKEIESFKVIDPGNSENNELYTQITYTVEPIPQTMVPIVDGDGNLDLLASGINFMDAQLWDESKKKLVYEVSDKTNTTLYFFSGNIYIKDKKTDQTVLLNKENFDSQLKIIANDCSSTLKNLDEGVYEYTLKSILTFTSDIDNCK